MDIQSLRNNQNWKIWIILHKIKSRLNTKSDVLTFLEAIL
jgi:hypothetical protein